MNSNNTICAFLLLFIGLLEIVAGQLGPPPGGPPPPMLFLPNAKEKLANMTDGVDWLGLHLKICSLSDSAVPAISKRFEECNKMSKFSQLEVCDIVNAKRNSKFQKVFFFDSNCFVSVVK